MKLATAPSTMQLIEAAWFIKISLFLFVALVLSLLESFFYQKLHPVLLKTKRAWDASLTSALHKPLQVFIWLMTFSLILPIVFLQLGIATEINQYLNPVRAVFLVLTLLWFVLRFINNTEKELFSRPLEKNKGIRDKTTLRAVTQLFRITFIVIFVLIALQAFGISITTLLAVGGVGGLALGFAAKDTLANFLGGMMIFWDRPFSVGDWIRSPDRSVEGIVEDIGWRLTRIRTFDKRPLYVPNGVFSTISIENPSRMRNRRIKKIIGLRYQDAPQIERILNAIRSMLKNHHAIDTSQTLLVNLFEFGQSSLDVLIYCFTKTTRWVEFQDVQQEIFLKIMEIITHHGAQCAFPTTTLDIPLSTKADDNKMNAFEGKGRID